VLGAIPFAHFPLHVLVLVLVPVRAVGTVLVVDSGGAVVWPTTIVAVLALGYALPSLLVARYSLQ
jgi:hypothetical protein